MFPEQIIYLTFIFYFIGYFYYLKDIFHGQNRPNLISWSLWALGPIIGAFFQIKAGAGWSALPTFMAGFGPLVVVFVSLWNKNAYWKITTLDIVCGIFALLALALYVLTHNLGISIIFAILSDVWAAIPTIVKSWKSPANESPQPYFVGIITNTIGLLIIKNWVFSIYSFGIYLVMINLTLIFCIYRKKIFMLYFRND